MTTNGNHDEYQKLFEREAQEIMALGSVTSDTLAKLNISIDNLPQKQRHLLTKYATAKHISGIDLDNCYAVKLLTNKHTVETLDLDYEILKLKHKNEQLQSRIDKNDKFIKDLRDEIGLSKASLADGVVNESNVEDLIRQLKQKLTSYEEAIEKAKAKFTKLDVPEAIYPKSLIELASTLAKLRIEESELKQKAEDISFVRCAKETFKNLKIF